MISQDFQTSLNVERQADYLAATSLLNTTSLKTLATNGVALINLSVTNIKSKLNRWEVELGQDAAYISGDEVLNSSNVKVGDIVGISGYPTTETTHFDVTGVVTTITSAKCIIDVSSNGTSDANSANDTLFSQAGDRSGHVNNTKELPLSNNQRVWILKLINETPYKRMEQAMKKLSVIEEQSALVNSGSGVIDILLGSRSPTVSNIDYTDSINSQLNTSQKSAINYALNSELTIIHGPPGTGKTKTVVDFIISSLRLNPRNRILVTAGSNVAVDTILERLVLYKDVLSPTEVVRVGHPSKMLSAKSVETNAQHEPSVDKKSKAAKLKRERKEKRSAKKSERPARSTIETSEMSSLEYRNHLLNTTHLQYILYNNFQPILKTIKEDLKKLEKQLDKPGTKYSERKALYSEIRDVQREKRNREHKALMEVLRNAKVIVGTVVGVGSNDIFFGVKDLLKENPGSIFFETIVIDEVSQTLEPACWIPILAYSPKKLVLAGDNKQLAPTVHCGDSDLLPTPSKVQTMANDILTSTLFDRLVSLYSKNGKEPEFVKFLNIQYRMNCVIQEFSSKEFYKGELKPDDSVKHHSLEDLVVNDDENDNFTEILEPLTWEDTCGLHSEFTDTESGSKYNIGECHLVKSHISKLVALGIKEEIIGVIAPYSAQVSKLRDIVWNRGDEDTTGFSNVEISTVDGFQGREKEVIILTLVRSNEEKEVGFLSDFKRLNVSITRAKRQLYVIGDFETINQSQCKVLKDWSNWMADNANIKYVEN